MRNGSENLRDRDRADAAPVAYCNFSDHRNVGDRALFEANVRMFPRFDLVPGIDSSDGALTANLFGGGTMYPYSIRYGHVRRRGMNLSVGLGVADPEDHGPFGFLTRRAMSRWRFEVMGVRGPRSQLLLAKHGIESFVTGDSALALKPGPGVARGEGEIAVNVVGEKMERRGDRSRVSALIEGLAERLFASGRSLLFVPFCLDDVDWSEELAERLSNRGPVDRLDYWGDAIGRDMGRFLDRLAGCEYMIGERLHAVVLAAASGVPFFSLGYKSKCFDFAESLGLGERVRDCRDADIEEIHATVEADLRRIDCARWRLDEQVESLRARLAAAAERIEAVVFDAAGASR